MPQKQPKQKKPQIARIPITNIYVDGAYTGRIRVGPELKELNVLFDSGSAALVLDNKKYQPHTLGGDETTRLAQYQSYSDRSRWSGGVIKTVVSVGQGEEMITVRRINAAIAQRQAGDVFGLSDGILGLAYAPIDEAWEMRRDTTATVYSREEIRSKGRYQTIKPYLYLLDRRGVVSDRFGFYTLRSCIHRNADKRKDAEDPLNKGWLILGGGEECRELYQGSFQEAKVLAEQWYNTNLKAVIVGNTAPLQVHRELVSGYPSNSIVDSGTNSLDIGPSLLKDIVSRFKPAQQKLMNAALARKKSQHVAMADLDLKSWPDLTFVLQGVTKKDVVLNVKPRDYWQVNAPKPGLATLAITEGEPGFTILGLPLMNGYFTIFDGEADHDRGTVKFAQRT